MSDNFIGYSPSAVASGSRQRSSRSRNKDPILPLSVASTAIVPRVHGSSRSNNAVMPPTSSQAEPGGHYPIPLGVAPFAPTNVQDIATFKDDFAFLCSQLSKQFDQCTLTKEEEKIKSAFMGDIKATRDLILSVLNAHRKVANAARQIARSASTSYPQNGTTLLKDAKDAVAESIRKQTDLRKRMVQRIQHLDSQVASRQIPVMIRLKNWVMSFRGDCLAQVFDGCSTIASACYELGNMVQLESKLTRALWGKLALGSTPGIMTLLGTFIQYIGGSEASAYQPVATANTQTAMRDLSNLLDTFQYSLRCLENYWKGTHSRRLADHHRMLLDAQALERVADMLDKHVDECLGLLRSMHQDTNLPGAGDLPSYSQLQQERATNYTIQVPMYLPPQSLYNSQQVMYTPQQMFLPQQPMHAPQQHTYPPRNRYHEV